MPRGKYVNHKGRSRHFTSPEEMEQVSEDESSSEESEEEEQASGSKGNKRKGAPPGTLPPSDSEEEESSEEEDRDAKKGVAGLIEIENPNRAVKKVTQKLQAASVNAEPELTRREREQIEKQKARLKYEKLHAEGKTSQAKADLARLAMIRQQRAEAAAKREAEKKAAEEKKTKA
ncbi:28 kDa heat- and acid-stable phosphoprotein [Haematobia irritans]|uniref:28 kDa heat- and acid-stable phosphoprotein n=1 Tax=Haematobia irritans TaxID=7368 RepID=UPI003F4FB131